MAKLTLLDAEMPRFRTTVTLFEGNTFGFGIGLRRHHHSWTCAIPRVFLIENTTVVDKQTHQILGSYFRKGLKLENLTSTRVPGAFGTQ
jgi:hypothetical protein